MGGITEKITEFIKDLLTGWITSNLDTMFTDVNTKVETIACGGWENTPKLEQWHFFHDKKSVG